MADIFISYAREDREWVEKLASQLVAEGFTVWWDWDLLVGKRYRETIETELQTAKAAVVVWSQHSVRSDFVRDEAEDAQQRNILLPLLKEIVRPPAGFRQLQTADLSNWLGGGEHVEFRRMLKGVSGLVGRAAAGDTGAIHVDPAHPTTHFDPAKAAPVEAAIAPPPDSHPAAKAPEPMPVSVSPPPSPPIQPTPAIQPMPPVQPVPPAPGPKIPLGGYIAIGAVAVLALLYVAVQFFHTSPKPTPPAPTTVATPAPAPQPAAGGTAAPAPAPAGGSTNGGDTGNDTGGDQGQTGPAPPANDAPPAPPPNGDNTPNGSTDNSNGDTGQGNNPH